MGGNNKGKNAKTKRKSAGEDGPTQFDKSKAKKAKMAESPAKQQLPQHSNFNARAKGAKTVAIVTQINDNLQENGPDGTVLTQVEGGNNNAIPASVQTESRSRPHSQESNQRQKLRDLRDSLKEKIANKGKSAQTDYGDGTEGCSKEPTSQIQVVEGRRVLRSKVNSTKNSHKTGNTPVKGGQSAERTEFSDNNVGKIGHTRRFTAGTEFSDVNTNEGHGRDPDGVSLDVSDDDYREENFNSDNDNFSEPDEASQDEGAISESAQEESEVEDRPPAQSSSESEEDVSSSSSSSSSDEDQPEFENGRIRKKFRKDPNYKRVLESLVAEKMRKKKERRKRRKREKREKRERRERRRRERGKVIMRSNVTSPPQVIRSNVTPHRIPPRYLSPIVKSPSDSTLYTPALKLLKQQGNTVLKGPQIVANTSENVNPVLNGPSNDTESEGIIEKISNFVDNMRIESARKSNKRDRRRSHSGDRDDSPPRRQDREEAAREVTDRIILESEKFKAQLVAPKGMPSRIDSSIELLRKLDNDDDFFHTSCHIEPALKLKIEQGEFVDLDKLLPIDKGAGGVSMNQDNRLGLVYEDGEAFLAPAKKVNKINSFRKWDTAFRVFSTIYSEANPHRASELLQYVQVIHLAASNNPWDNVAFYDFTFRQLMASKPWRSWAKTYTQGWNLAFTNTGRGVSNGNYSNSNASSSSNRGGKVPSKGSGNWKDDCCWKYNKNQCSRSSTECKWNHRCTFCAGWNHSKANCKKRQKPGGSPSTPAVAKTDTKK